MKLQNGEKVILEIRPDSKLLYIWSITQCLPRAVSLGFLSFAIRIQFVIHGLSSCRGRLSTEEIFKGPIIFSICMAVVFLAVLIIYYYYLHQTHLYVITDTRCIFKGGILRHIERSIPFHKITDVEQSQNILERIFGIGSLNLFTPGTSSMSPYGIQKPEIKFEGLVDREAPAEAINQILRQFKTSGA
jgi:uncharacterized membrane protein YdbT with pleckstrin-like domain